MPRSTLVDHPVHPPNIMFDNPSSFHVEDFFNLDMLTDSVPSTSHSTTDSAQSDRLSSTTASSDAGSDSPTGSFTNLQTPPQADALPSFDVTAMGMGMNIDMSAFGGLPPIEEESMFTLGGGSDYFKPGTDPLAGLSHSSFDLFGSFDSVLGGDATSSDTSTTASAPASHPGSSSNSNSTTSFPYAAIDPQLVGTPAPSTSTDSPSDVGAEPDSDDDDHRGLIAPIKVGGKGKARRGTLHSGGVSKKSALPGPPSIFGSLSIGEGPSSFGGKGAGKSKDAGRFSGKDKAAKDKDKDQDDEDGKDDDADDWRPTPEEYAKMSSKEKRQLRNKISARNFRIRRKEYIHTLEGDIADRDRLIDAIRNELGSTKSENTALRQEVAALKKAILEGRASPMLPPPAPLSPLSPLSNFASLPTPGSSNANSTTTSATSSSINIIKPNTHKDLPTSPRLGASPFWGGQAGFGGFGGGITPVHTAIIPETTASIFGGESPNANLAADRQNENMNPAMNGQHQHHQVLSQVLSQLYGSNANSNGTGASNGFDSFADVNPFTLKTLDAYRMQLWSRVALQNAQRARSSYNGTGCPSPHSSPSQSPTPGAAPGLSGLATGLRPLGFIPSGSPTSPTSGPSKPSLSALLSGKGLSYTPPHAANTHGHGLPSPPPSPRMGEKERAQQQAQARRAVQQREQVQTHALLASIASQTMLQKLGHAFWEAFSGSGTGSSPLGPSASARAWDAEKVRRVLDGSAVLQVVDVEKKPSATASTSADTLADGLRSMSLGTPEQEKKEDNERKGCLSRMSFKKCSKQ